jgi:hypothetical protein
MAIFGEGELRDLSGGVGRLLDNPALGRLAQSSQQPVGLGQFAQQTPAYEPMQVFARSGFWQGAQQGFGGTLDQSLNLLAGDHRQGLLMQEANYQTSLRQPSTDPGGFSGGGGGTGGGSSFGGGSTPGTGDNETLTGGQIDQYIAKTRPGSPLAGMGQFILDTANQQGVSVPQLLGIMTLESGLGTEQGTLPGVFNYGGLTGTGWAGQTGNTTGMARAFATFASKEDGVRALIANLASPNYKGKTIQQQTGLWYLGNENAGLDQSDEQNNATMRQYLDTIGGVYQGLGVPFNPSAPPRAATPRGQGGGGDGTLGTINADWARFAESVMGTPYTNSGIRNSGNPADGMDCSSFAGRALGIPRTLWNAQAQYDNTARVAADQARPGDLVFFQGTTADDPSARPVTHVGIYIGGGKMVQTGGPGGVMISDVNSDYWRGHLYGYGRWQGGGGGNQGNH